MNFLPFFLVPPPYRIIAFDGGGIYGYFTTLMLRKLCERDQNFLNGQDNTIFAGISAGALIALRLAKEEVPRKAILNGDIENMFKDYRLYSNLDPVTATASLFGLSSWCSGPLMKDFVQETWGELSLGELPQRVMISAWDFNGPQADLEKRKWGTRSFRNFGEDNQSGVSAAFVAYGATAPATYRPVEGGIGDAGYFAINPTMATVTLISALGPEEEKFWTLGNQIKETIHDMLAALKDLIGIILQSSTATYDDLRTRLMRDQQTILDLLSQMKEIFRGMIGKNFGLEVTENLIKGLTLLDDMLLSDRFMCDYPETFDALADQICIKKNVHGILDLWKIFVDAPMFPEDTQWKREWSSVALQITHDFFGQTSNHLGFFELLQNENRSDSETQLLVISANNLLQNTYGLFIAATDQLPNRTEHTQALSMGTGTFIPGYALKNFDLGWLNINLIPTNEPQQAMAPPPFWLILDPSIESTNTQASELLGERYLRFSPPVVKSPVPNMAVALYLSRFALLRQRMLKGIEEKAATVQENHFRLCSGWLALHGWLKDPRSTGASA